MSGGVAGARVGRVIGALLLGAYLLGLYTVAFSPLGSPRLGVKSANLIPLKTILAEIGDPIHSALHKAYYLVGNLCLTAPLIVALLLLKPDIKRVYLVLLALVVSIGTEVAQYGWIAGRVGDVDDVLLATVGAILTCALATRLPWLGIPRDGAAPSGTAGANPRASNE